MQKSNFYTKIQKYHQRVTLVSLDYHENTINDKFLNIAVMQVYSLP